MAKFKPIGIPTTNGISLGVDLDNNTLAVSTTGPSGYIPITNDVPSKISELENDLGYITSSEIPETSSFITKDVSNLSNYYTKEISDEKFASKTDITTILYVEEFPVSGINNTIYISNTGETKFWNGNEFINISYEALNEIIKNEKNNSTIPTIKAVLDYLETYATKLDVTEAITSAMLSGQVDLSPYALKNDLNNFQPISGMTIYATKTEIPVTSSFITKDVSNLTNFYNKTESDEKYATKIDIASSLNISEVTDFPSAGLNNTLYVNDENQTKIYLNDEWKDVSIKVVETIQNANEVAVPTVEAVSSFVEQKLENLDIPSTEIDLSNYYTKTESDNKYLLSSELNNYYNKTETDEKYALKTEIPVTSSFITKDVSDLNNYYNKSDSDNKYALKTEIPITSSFITKDVSDLNNYYNKSDSDEKYALKDDVNSKLALSVVEDFPTSGINNTLYVNNENQAQIYANDQWKNITNEVAENLDNPNQTTVPTTQAVKDYVETNKLNVNDYNSISKINFKNARVNLESTSGGIVNIDTSMNVENESIDNLGNPLILRGDFLGNSENTILLYTGDNTETISNNITTFTNIALNKDYLGDVTTYNTVSFKTYDNVPPIYGQDSSGHKSFGADYTGDISIIYAKNFPEYIKISFWYYFKGSTNSRFLPYIELYDYNRPIFQIYNDNSLRIGGQNIGYVELNKWCFVECVYKLQNNPKIKIFYNGVYKGDYSVRYDNLDTARLWFRKFDDNFYLDQFKIDISSEEEYNNFENTEHPVPTSASEVIKSTSFVINDIDNVPEDGKLFIKSKNQTYTIQPSLISDLNSLSVDTFNKVKTLSFPNAKTYLDSTDDSKVIVDTTTTYNNYTADEIGNSMWLNGHFIGNNDQCKLLYTGDSYDTLSNYPLNIAIGKDSTYSVQDPSKTIPRTSSYYPPIYSDSETHYSLYNGTGFSITGLDTTSCYKFSMWFMRTGFDSKGFFLLKNNNLSYGFFRIESYGEISIGSGDNRLYTYDYSKYGVWYYVELVVNNGAIKFYIGTSEDRDQGLKAKLAVNTTVNASNVKINPSDILRIHEHSSNFYIDQLSFQTLTEAEYGNYDEYGVTIPATASSVELFATFDTSKVDNIQNTDLIDIIRGKTRNQVEISALSSVISSIIEYPIANTETLGMVKVGDNLTVDDTGILNVNLNNYYTKVNTDEKFATKIDIASSLNVLSVNEFPATGLNNTLYINEENNETKVYLENDWKNLSMNVVEDLLTPDQNTIPTTQAVSAFVDQKLENLDIPSTEIDLSNYYTKVDTDEKFATKIDIASSLNVLSVNEFPTTGLNNTLYINEENNETKVYLNEEWKNLSMNVVEDLLTPNQNTIPTTQAVKDYVDAVPIGPLMKTEVTTNTITFKKDISIYKIEVNEATTFTFDFSQLDENNCYTFELWISMLTPVSLTFPSDVAWLNDEAPDMSAVSTYCIVVRKLPSTMGTSTITSPKALLNLAYQYALTLG